MRNTRNSLNQKNGKKRKKLPEESNFTSKKNEHNIIYKQYLSPFHSSNTDIKRINSKQNINNIIKVNLFQNSSNKFQVISSDIDEEINYNNYKDLYYTKRYKDEHNYKKKYLNEQDDFNKNLIISTKILDKNISTKNNIINSKQKIKKREFSNNKSKNQLFKRIYLDKIDFSKEKKLNRKSIFQKKRN